MPNKMYILIYEFSVGIDIDNVLFINIICNLYIFVMQKWRGFLLCLSNIILILQLNIIIYMSERNAL